MIFLLSKKEIAYENLLISIIESSNIKNRDIKQLKNSEYSKNLRPKIVKTVYFFQLKIILGLKILGAKIVPPNLQAKNALDQIFLQNLIVTDFFSLFRQCRELCSKV